MLKRSNALLRFLEAGAMGWFLVQAARFLTMWVFARTSGADIAARLFGPDSPLTDTVTVEMAAVAVGALVPLLGLLLQRWSAASIGLVALAGFGHVMMVTEDPTAQIISAAGMLGACGLYFTVVARHHADYFPLGLVAGLVIDQVVRAFGDTQDFSLHPDYLTLQTIASVLALGAAILSALTQEEAGQPRPDAEEIETPEAPGDADDETEDSTPEQPPAKQPTRKGKITLWGGVALGALMFLELALLALPSAAARVSGVSYAALLPWLIGATVLPALPAVRGMARRFIGIFDGAFRGWLWFLLIGLALVVGTRLGGMVGAGGMVAAQFFAALALWWVIEPARKDESGYTGLSIVIAWAVFALLAAGNLFIFVYGATTNPVVASFKGLGWIIFMLAALLGCLPVIVARVRIPWRGGSFLATLGLLVLGGGAVYAAVWATQPLIAQSVPGAAQLRIATLNIHSGYDTLYNPSLDEIANLIRETSVDIVLLQQVDAGRLTSNGVDQAWWLARTLRMEMAYYPTSESVYGLAVLTRVRKIDEDGSPLTSRNEQTGVQRVRVCTEMVGDACPPANIIDIYNTWLGLPERDVEPEATDQWKQISEVLRWVQQNITDAGVAAPWVALGGTFNATPDALLYDQMEVYEYKDPFAALMIPPDQAVTYCPGACLARFDYVWLRNLTPQVAAAVPRIDAGTDLLSFPSTHRMAVVEVRLERGTGEATGQ
ncbi:MAG: hypothetical protein JXB47_10445 [Anaerolineae bacterium]|nr:hypothetical protein [Anaerolineae bacterium]